MENRPIGGFVRELDYRLAHVDIFSFSAPLIHSCIHEVLHCFVAQRAIANVVKVALDDVRNLILRVDIRLDEFLLVGASPRQFARCC